MKRLVLVSIALTWLVALSALAKSEMKKAYIFGVATSFNDSTVYFTEIQPLDSAWFTKKNFLVSRENYSAQLKDYLESQLGEKNRTCMVVYGYDQKKLEKKWTKLHTHYTAKKKYSKSEQKKHYDQLPPYQLKLVSSADFAFQGVMPSEEYEAKMEMQEKESKKNKGKRGPGPGNGPGKGPGNGQMPPPGGGGQGAPPQH